VKSRLNCEESFDGAEASLHVCSCDFCLCLSYLEYK
jgi:hypothetical protein